MSVFSLSVAAFIPGQGLSLAGNVLNVNTAGSLTVSSAIAANSLQLVNDATAPGTSYYYGTDSGGSKGWFAISSTEVSSIIGTAGQVLANGTSVTPQTGAVTLTLASALTGINSITSTAGQPLVLATGTTGTALTIASATNAATFAGNLISMAGGSSWTDNGSGQLTIAGGSTNLATTINSPGSSGQVALGIAGTAQFKVSGSVSAIQIPNWNLVSAVSTDQSGANTGSIQTAGGIYVAKSALFGGNITNSGASGGNYGFFSTNSTNSGYTVTVFTNDSGNTAKYGIGGTATGDNLQNYAIVASSASAAGVRILTGGSNIAATWVGVNLTLAGNLTLGASTSSITGAAGNMTIVAGTGNSRQLILQSTTSGGTATTALTLDASQNVLAPNYFVTTSAANAGGFFFNSGLTDGWQLSATHSVTLYTNNGATLTLSGAASATLTGGAGNMTIAAGTGASRTLALQSTTSGSTATTFLTGNADQSVTFAGALNGITSINSTSNFQSGGASYATGSAFNWYANSGTFSGGQIMNVQNLGGGSSGWYVFNNSNAAYFINITVTGTSSASINTTNLPLGINGRGSGGVTIGNSDGTGTSGSQIAGITQTGLIVADSAAIKALNISPGFAPVANSGEIRVVSIRPTINATGTSTSNYVALDIAVSETALLGSSNFLIRANAGTTGVTTKFSVDNSGNTILGGNLTLGASTSSITGAAGNMTITAGTGNSRTLALQTTTSGGSATTALTLDASQGMTVAGNNSAFGTAVLAGSGVIYAGDPGSGTYGTVASTWVSLYADAQKVTGTAGIGIGVLSFLVVAGGTQTYGMGLASRTPSGTVTNMTHLFMGDLTNRATGNWGIYDSSGYNWSLTGNIINASDARIKNSIAATDLGLAFLLKLRPVSYELNAQPGARQYGLIAQEVQAAGGESLVTNAGGVLGIAYTQLIAPLIKGEQELHAEIVALKARVAQLEATHS